MPDPMADAFRTIVEDVVSTAVERAVRDAIKAHVPAPVESADRQPDPLLVDETEAGRLLGISARSVFALNAAGELNAIYLGQGETEKKSKRYDRRDLVAFIDKKKGAAAQ